MNYIKSKNIITEAAILNEGIMEWIMGILAAVGGVTVAYKYRDRISSYLNNIKPGLGDTVKSFLETIGNPVASGAQTGYNAAKDMTTKAYGAAKQGVSGAGNIAAGAAEGIKKGAHATADWYNKWSTQRPSEVVANGGMFPDEPPVKNLQMESFKHYVEMILETAPLQPQTPARQTPPPIQQPPKPMQPLMPRPMAPPIIKPLQNLKNRPVNPAPKTIKAPTAALLKTVVKKIKQ